ncbi:MAG: hypothetical protein LBJ31_01715 [Treponema sp.]|jgi:hypothetical protein|nr:hypothetical protein [Treponema sp.]
MNNKAAGKFANAAGGSTFSLLLCGLLFFAALPVFAQDFGLVVRQNAVIGDDDGSYVEYTGTVLPWFAAPLGDNADLYLSGGLSAEYVDEEWRPLPEINRFELSYDPRPGLRIEAGRLPFRETSAVMAGLFDGLSFRLNAGGGRLTGGVFYTGLLYKKAAHIIMIPEDRAAYNDRDEYFASRRLAANIHWEKTGIFNTRNTLSLLAAVQFDLNGDDTVFHSQYLEAKAGIPLGGRVNAELGGVLELVETDEPDDAAGSSKSSYTAFALSTHITWLLPTALEDRLSAGGRFFSGRRNDQGPFIPLTLQTRGRVLRPEPLGIALLETVYTAGLSSGLSADLCGTYYFRTDRETFQHPGIDSLSRSPLLGGEVYGGLTWMPFSEVLLSAGGGVFLPRTGNVFTSDAALIYRVELGLSISF